MKVQFYLRFQSQYGQTIYLNPSDALSTGTAMPLTYVNDEYWKCTLDLPAATQYTYSYVVKQAGTHDMHMHGYLKVTVPSGKSTDLVVIDSWNDLSRIENTFFTQAFRKIFQVPDSAANAAPKKGSTHRFSIQVPVLPNGYEPVLLGAGDGLHDWSKHQPVTMHSNGDYWTAEVNLAKAEWPVAYKYALYNQATKVVDQYEDGPNRSLYFAAQPNQMVDLRDGFIRLNTPLWRGSGVAIPVFSLRSEQSLLTCVYWQIGLRR
jgi:4-alpha-glucanotransferase